MNRRTYRELLHDLGLTQIEAAALVGASRATAQRWAQRGLKGPEAVVFTLLRQRKISVNDIRATRQA